MLWLLGWVKCYYLSYSLLSKEELSTLETWVSPFTQLELDWAPENYYQLLSFSMKSLKNVFLAAKWVCLQNLKTKLFGKKLPNTIPFISYLGIPLNNYSLKHLSHGSVIHLGTVEMACFICVQIPYSYHSFEGGDIIYMSKYAEEPLPRTWPPPPNPHPYLVISFITLLWPIGFYSMTRQVIRWSNTFFYLERNTMKHQYVYNCLGIKAFVLPNDFHFWF